MVLNHIPEDDRSIIVGMSIVFGTICVIAICIASWAIMDNSHTPNNCAPAKTTIITEGGTLNKDR